VSHWRAPAGASPTSLRIMDCSWLSIRVAVTQAAAWPPQLCYCSELPQGRRRLATVTALLTSGWLPDRLQCHPLWPHHLQTNHLQWHYCVQWQYIAIINNMTMHNKTSIWWCFLYVFYYYQWCSIITATTSYNTDSNIVTKYCDVLFVLSYMVAHCGVVFNICNIRQY
jgi:hypothetical protein